MPSNTAALQTDTLPPATGPAPGSRVAVIVASIRRAEEIGQLLHHLARQTLLPSAIVLSVEKPADLPQPLPPNVEVIMGPKGLTLQRNRGLDRVLADSDVVVFFDDDFVPADDALARLAELFRNHPDIAGATGLVLRDGVKDGGLPYEDAVAAIQDYAQAGARPITIEPTDALYGCNMAFRAAAVGSLRFDEILPLYGWQEDVDFTGQLLPRGRIVKSNAFAGVHRGVNKGRTPGRALGYSQMINPIYLVRKGTMRPWKAATLMLKNFAANHAGLIRPEPFIDRAGRSRGNWMGLLDILRGKCDPRGALQIN